VAGRTPQFTEEIEHVDRLLTVGWRGAEPHALELLGGRIQRGFNLGICDVDNDACAAILSNLGTTGQRCPQPSFFTNGFSGLLDGDSLESWLDLPVPFQGGMAVPPMPHLDDGP
jgi:hypothetical protein